MAKKKEEKKQRKSLTIEVMRQMLTLATSGFGLVAALAWNNLVQELVSNYIKPFFAGGSSTVSLLIYAVIITVLAVFVTYQLSKILDRLEN